MNRKKWQHIILLAWLGLSLLFPALQQVSVQANRHDQATPTMIIACDAGGGSGNGCGGVADGGV